MSGLIIHFERVDMGSPQPWPIGVNSDNVVLTGLGSDDGSVLIGFGPLGEQHVDIWPDGARDFPDRVAGLVPSFTNNGSMFEWACIIAEVTVIEDAEDEYRKKRAAIVEGLKRWAHGMYTTQTAVTFLAGTDEPLTRVWVEPTLINSEHDGYWLNWDSFDEYGGGLSSGEYATWAIARSLCEGELDKYLWSLSPDREKALLEALSRSRENWPHE